MSKKLYVTKTHLPPIERYKAYIDQIWERGWITNHGELVGKLAVRLQKCLDAKQLCLTSNGTLALQIAIKALAKGGEIITTPFSYVATTSSIVWQGCKPVYADIEPGTLCIDPAKIEQAITPQTTAILATHVYGNACDVEAISGIAERHGLKVIYDAAHAFGASYRGKPLCNYGDASILSFHATKLFHTIEGGALICNDKELHETFCYMRNFGHDGEEAFHGLGINAKMNEFSAAMGLCVLDDLDGILAKRKAIHENYNELLDGLPITGPRLRNADGYNHAYYPVLFADEAACLAVQKALNKEGIYPRRYFYPPLNQLPYVEHAPMPVSDEVSRRVLCLPVSSELPPDEQERVSQIIRKTIG